MLAQGSSRAATLQVEPVLIDVTAPGAASTITLRNEAAAPINVQIRVYRWSQVDGKEMELTPTEFRLLECLLRQPDRAFTRAQLMDAAIGEDAVVLERTIDVHIKTLRRKLGKAGDRIQTVRDVGYRFQDTV